MENQIYSDFQLARSYVNQKDGIGFTSSFNYESTHPWEFWFLNSYFDKSFNIDKTGYLWRNNLEEYSLGIGYKVRDSFWKFRKLFFSTELEYANNLDKLPIEKKIIFTLTQLWQNYWHSGIITEYSPKHYDDLLTYDYEDGDLGPVAIVPKSNGWKCFVQTDQRNLFSGRLEYGIGTNSLNDRGTNLFSSLKFSPNENLKFSLEYYRGKSKEKYHWVEITEYIEILSELPNSTNEIKHFIFSNAENKVTSLTSRLNLNFNRNTSLQIYSEYYMTHTNHIDNKFYELLPDSSVFPIPNTEYLEDVYIDPTQDQIMPGDEEEFNRGNILASPNIEPTLYPKYSNYSTNIVFHWDYSPGSSLYFVYTYYKGINGELLSNPLQVLSYQLKNKKWIETYLDHSIFIKLDYWFDI